MIDPEKEREDFVSIRELVGLIAASTGKTEKQAAAMLAASMTRNEAWQRLPLCEWSPVYGSVPIEEPHSRQEGLMLQRLERWAEIGSSEPDVGDFGDDRPF